MKRSGGPRIVRAQGLVHTCFRSTVFAQDTIKKEIQNNCKSTYLDRATESTSGIFLSIHLQFIS